MSKPKLTAARERVLLHMIQTNCQIGRAMHAGWTRDEYQWPISGSTLDALIADGLITPAPVQTSNQMTAYIHTPAAVDALRDHLS